MSVDALYREQVLKHARDPINFRRVEHARHVPGNNPLCGDKLDLYVTIDGDTITDVSFHGVGCAISMASASMMSELLSGLDTATAGTLVDEVHAMLAECVDSVVSINLQDLSLAALSEVRRYPSRVKCAKLAWHAMAAALQGDSDPVSTE